MVKVVSATLLVLASLAAVAWSAPQMIKMRPMRPFIACRGCDSFMHCVMMCPFKEYPGINVDGVYDPEMLRSTLKSSIKKMSSYVPKPLKPRPLKQKKRPRRNNTSRVRNFFDKVKKNAMKQVTQPITQPLALINSDLITRR